MLHIVSAISIMVASCSFQQPVNSDSPEQVIEFFLTHQVGWPNQYDDLKARIRREPEKYAHVIAELLAAPKTIENWVPLRPEDRGNPLAGTMGIFGHRLIPLLGRQHAEPIITKYFRDGYRLYTQVIEETRRIEVMNHDELGVEDREKRIARLWEQRGASMGMMSQAVGVAMQLQSPVLVDDLLKFWEAGYNDRKSNLPRYPLMFAHERKDIIPRLRAVMENPKTDPMVKHQIEKAFEWYAATLASADQGEAVLAEADTDSPPPPSAPSPDPAQPPR